MVKVLFSPGCGHTLRGEEKVVGHAAVIYLHQWLGGGILQQRTFHLEVKGQDHALVFGQRERS